MLRTSNKWLRTMKYYHSYSTNSSKPCCHAKQMESTTASETIPASSTTTSSFWSDSILWKKASFNTLNCLIGCSIGDFSMLWFLNSYYPTLSMQMMMPLAMMSGIASSLSLETIILKYKNKQNSQSMSWKQAFQIAWKMSLISMLAMELAENITDYYILNNYNKKQQDEEHSTTTMRLFQTDNPIFWIGLVASLLAGFITPLPYNYYMLKKFAKSCH